MILVSPEASLHDFHNPLLLHSAAKGADKREGDKSSTSGQSPRSGEPSENDGEGAGEVIMGRSGGMAQFGMRHQGLRGVLRSGVHHGPRL